MCSSVMKSLFWFSVIVVLYVYAGYPLHRGSVGEGRQTAE